MCKYKAFVAMGLIAGIEFLALSKGINGVALSLSVASLAGLGGYEVKDMLMRRKPPAGCTLCSGEDGE